MDIIIKKVSFDKREKTELVGGGLFETNKIDNAIIFFKANNDKIKMDGNLTVGRKEFEKNISNLEQMIKGYILG